MPAQTVIKLRRDTAANWDTTNPVLAAGEQGYETDTGLIKIGDGTTAWGALNYQAASRLVQPVKNMTGSSIAKGSVVYISGATGGDALISLADADGEATSSKTIGLLGETVANDAYGEVICEGLIVGVNTSAATAGDSVWLSSTAGGFVFAAPPAKPAHSVYLGVVTRVHATEGEILIKVQNGYELSELHDVNITGTIADNEVLAWDDASQMWINQTAAEAGLAAASHTHGMADLNGTGAFNITSAVDRQVLVYDNASSKWINGYPNETLTFAVSDEVTNLTTGTAKITFRAPFAMTLTQIPRASLSTASTSGLVTCDINEAGTSVLGANKLSIDANEKTSTTAATATTLADTAIADDAEITIDIDAAGTGAKGLKITLYYRRA